MNCINSRNWYKKSSIIKNNWYQKLLIAALHPEINGNQFQLWPDYGGDFFRKLNDGNAVYSVLKSIGFRWNGDKQNSMWWAYVNDLKKNPNAIPILTNLGIDTSEINPIITPIVTPVAPIVPPVNNGNSINSKTGKFILSESVGIPGLAIGVPVLVWRDGGLLAWMTNDGQSGTLPNDKPPNAYIKSIKDSEGKVIRDDDIEHLFEIYDAFYYTPSETEEPVVEEPDKEITTEEIASNEISGRIPEDKISPYQKKIEVAFRDSKDNMVINALAGTGKTSVLKHIASFKDPKERWLYLVFNKKNQVEAEPDFKKIGVDVLTSHSFLGKMLSTVSHEDFPTGKLDTNQDRTGQMVKDALEMSTLIPRNSNVDKRRYPDGRVYYNAKVSLLNIVDKCKSNAVDPRNSANLSNAISAVIDQYDIETDIQNRDKKGNPMGPPIEVRNELIAEASTLLLELLPGANLSRYGRVPKEDGRGFWNNSRNYQGVYNHDDTLWYSALNGNNIQWAYYPVVLVDEVQDFNKCQQIMLENLIGNGSRIVAVGDPHQCVIEGTKILMNDGSECNVESINCDDKTLSAKGSGQLRESNIDDIYKRYVEDKDMIEIKTESGYCLTTTLDHMHFANYLDMDNCWFTYLMYREDLGYRIGITKNHKIRSLSERSDSIWIIKKCNSEKEARYYEQLYSIRYGIPTWVFEVNSRCDNLSYDNEYVKKLFSEIDTIESAKKISKDFHINLSYPHHIKKSSNRDRKNFSISICADVRYDSLHKYSISGSDLSDSLKLNNIGIKTRDAKNCKGWRIEGENSDLGYIYNLLDKIKSEININVIEKGNFEKGVSLNFCPASNLREGMSIFINRNGEIKNEKIIKVNLIKYTGYIYDLNIDRVHNYIANGIVTHNSIYMFRGADSQSFDRVQEIVGGGQDSFELPVNYRCGKKIINFVNNDPKSPVHDLQAGLSHDGEVILDEDHYGCIADVIEEYHQNNEKLSTPTAFIARTNNILQEAALKFISEDVEFEFIGFNMSQKLLGLCEEIVGKGRMKKNISMKEFETKLGQKSNSLLSIFDNLFGNEKSKGEEMKRINEAVSHLLSGLIQYNSQGVVNYFDKLGNKEIKTSNDFIDFIKRKFKGLNFDSENDDEVERIKRFQDRDTHEYIALCSAHRSKGLEFERVYVLGQDQFPSKRAKTEKELEQEKNAWYVALTRAKNELHIPVPPPKD